MAMGDSLVSKGLITEDQLKQALAEQQSSGERLGDVLVKLGFISKADLEAALG